MFMTLFLWGTVVTFLGLTAWGSYRQYTLGKHAAPPWRAITVDTLRRTVPVIVLTFTVTSFDVNGALTDNANNLMLSWVH